MTSARALLRLLPVLLPALGAGCAAPLPRQSPSAASCLPAISAEDYPGAPMAGFDALAGTGEDAWREGDRALLALSLVDGDRIERWLLDLEVIDDLVDGTKSSMWGGMLFESDLMLVRVTVAGAAGDTLGQTTVRVPRDWLAFGLAPCCELTDRLYAMPEGSRQEEAAGALRTWLQGFATLTGLLELVQNDPTLAGILWRVVRTPSVFSLLGSLGTVSVTIKTDYEGQVSAERPPHLPEVGASWCLPVDLLVNDEQALYCDLLIGTPRPPYSLCAGIVGMQASHPSDPDLRFSYVLLSARRGPEGPARRP